MFGLLARPQVLFIQMKDRKVTFKSNREFPLGLEQKLRLVVPQAVASEPVPIRVFIEKVRPLSQGGFACTGELAGGTALPALEAYLGNLNDDGLRQSIRYPCRLPVRGPAFPENRAMTVDFCCGGIQVELAAPIPVGTATEVSLSFEGQIHRCQARVSWCAGNHQDGYRAGLAFQSVEGTVQEILKAVQRRLENGEEVRAGKKLPTVEQAECDLSGLGVVTGYSLDEKELVVTLKTKDGLKAYQFVNPSGLMDLYGVAGRAVHALRDSQSPGKRRFHFLDEDGNVLLEVVAAALNK